MEKKQLFCVGELVPRWACLIITRTSRYSHGMGLLLTVSSVFSSLCPVYRGFSNGVNSAKIQAGKSGRKGDRRMPALHFVLQPSILCKAQEFGHI